MYTRNSSRCAFGHFGSSWFIVVQIICDRSDKPKNELDSSPGITFIIVMTVVRDDPKGQVMHFEKMRFEATADFCGMCSPSFSVRWPSHSRSFWSWSPTVM